MDKKESARKIITSLGFVIGIVITIGIIMCVGKIFNTKIEDTSNSASIEELQEEIERLEEKLQYKENRVEELEKRNEENEELIELLRTQLEELDVEPYEL